MSCFVIDKASYARAAGIVAGISATANMGGLNDRFWLYDEKHGRNMIGPDYLEKFCEVYEMNVASVSESWGEELETDKGDYMADFLQAMSIGKRAYNHRWENGGYLAVIQELMHFFRSIRYQIDNPDLEKKACEFLNEVAVKLSEQLNPNTDHDSWGSLELETFDGLLKDAEDKTRWIVQRALGY